MAALFGGEGLWAASSSLFFSETEVDRLLNAGEPELTVEALLSADTIVQDTQAHSPRLISYLSTPKAINRLLYFLTVPQDTTQQDAAYRCESDKSCDGDASIRLFALCCDVTSMLCHYGHTFCLQPSCRFPYMACEIISCAVRPILDALVSRTGDHEHMRVLFAFVAPHVIASRGSSEAWLRHLGDDHAGALRRRADAAAAPALADEASLGAWQQEREGSGSGGGLLLRPYLAGYWCKVVSMLCRRRPADVCRFLTRVPDILPALAQQLPNGNFAGLLTALLDLPLRPARLPARLLPPGGPTFRLHPGDSASVGDILLGVLERAFKLAQRFAASSSADPVAARECASAASSACSSVAEVAAACLLKARSSSPHAKFAAEDYNASRLRGSGSGSGSSGSGSGSSSGASDGTPGGASGSATAGVAGEEAAAAAALAAVVAAAVAGTDDDDTRLAAAACRINTQVDATFHEPGFRPEDSCNTLLLRWLRDGDGADKLASLASRSVSQALERWGEVGAAASSAALLRSVASSCLDVLTAAVDAAAFGWRQQQQASPVATGPCPRLLQQLLDVLPVLSGAAATLSQAGFRATTAAASSSGSGEAPYPSSPTAPKLGALGLSLCRCLSSLLRCGWPEVAAAVARTGVILRLLDCMSAFAWHSVLHRTVTDALLACVHEGAATASAASAGAASGADASSSSSTVWGRALLHDAALLSRIVSACKLAGMPPALPASVTGAAAAVASPSAGSSASVSASSGSGSSGSSLGSGVRSPAGPRVGYGGHMASIANCVLSAYARGKLGSLPPPPTGGIASAVGTAGQQQAGGGDGSAAAPMAPLVALVQSHGDWWRFVDRELTVHNVMRGVLIGGLAPDSSKSGQVGANADATGGRPAAVDEVAALEQKDKGAGGDSGSDSGSDDAGSDHGSDGDSDDEAHGSGRAHKLSAATAALTSTDAWGGSSGSGAAAAAAPHEASDEWGGLRGTGSSATAPDEWGGLSSSGSGAAASQETSDEWGSMAADATSSAVAQDASDDWATFAGGDSSSNSRAPQPEEEVQTAANEFETGW